MTSCKKRAITDRRDTYLGRPEEEDGPAPKKMRKALIEIFNRSSLCIKSADERMSIFLRVKPFTNDDDEIEDQGCIVINGEDDTVVAIPPEISHTYRNMKRGLGKTSHKFTFSRVFNERTSQAEFFNSTVLSMTKEFISGQNSLVFTYGVTSSGKTYTLQGKPQDAGVLPRCLDVLFNSINNRQIEGIKFKPFMFTDVIKLSPEEEMVEKKLKEKLMRLTPDTSMMSTFLKDESQESNLSDTMASSASSMHDESLHKVEHRDRENLKLDVNDDDSFCFSIWVSFAEIYNEQIFDLLVPLSKKNVKRPALKICDDRTGSPYIKGLREIHVNSADEAYKLLTIGQHNLQTASTRLNQCSSRSHSIFTIKIIRTVDTDDPQVAKMNMLSLCDLAGSERSSQTKVNGERLKEAGNINTSLMTLSRCIETLRYNQVHRDQPKLVPFRDSKLTRLFQNFFNGSGRAAMIVNVSQCASLFDETLNVFKFSAIAKQVRYMAKAPEPMKWKKKVLPLVPPQRPSIPWEDPEKEAIFEEASNDPLPEDDEEDEEEEDLNETDLESDVSVQSRSIHQLEQEIKSLTYKNNQLVEMMKEEIISSGNLERQVRKEVTDAMCKQMVLMEKTYSDMLKESREDAQEALEGQVQTVIDIYEEKLERLQRKADDEDEWVSSCLLYREEMKVKERDEQISQLEQGQEKLQSLYDSLSTQSSSQESLISSLQAELKEMKSKCQESEEHVIQQKKETKAAQQENDIKFQNKDSTIKTLEEECRQMQEEIERLQDQMSQLGDESKRSDITTSDAFNPDEIESLKKENTDLKTELTELQSAHKIKEAEDHEKFQNKEKEANELHGMVASLKQQITQLESENQSLKDQLDTRNQEVNKVCQSQTTITEMVQDIERKSTPCRTSADNPSEDTPDSEVFFKSTDGGVKDSLASMEVDSPDVEVSFKSGPALPQGLTASLDQSSNELAAKLKACELANAALRSKLKKEEDDFFKREQALIHGYTAEIDNLRHELARQKCKAELDVQTQASHGKLRNMSQNTSHISSEAEDSSDKESQTDTEMKIETSDACIQVLTDEVTSVREELLSTVSAYKQLQLQDRANNTNSFIHSVVLGTPSQEPNGQGIFQLEDSIPDNTLQFELVESALKIEELKCTLDKDKNQIQQKENKIEKMLTDQSNLEKQLKGEIKKRAELENVLEEKNIKILSLDKQLKGEIEMKVELESVLEEKNIETLSHDKQFKGEIEKRVELERVLEEKTVEILSLDKQLKGDIEKRVELETVLEEKNVEILRLQTEAREMNSKYELNLQNSEVSSKNLENAFKEVNRENCTLKEELKDKATKSEHYEEKIKELNLKLEENKQDLKDKGEELENLSAKLHTALTAKSGLNSELTALENKIEKIEGELQANNEELQEKISELNDLYKARDECDNEREVSKKDNEKLRKLVDDLSIVKNDLQSQVKSREKNLEAVKAELEEELSVTCTLRTKLEEQEQEKAGEIKDFDRQLKAQEKELCELKSLLNDVSQEKNHLEEEIEKMKEVHQEESANVSQKLLRLEKEKRSAEKKMSEAVKREQLWQMKCEDITQMREWEQKLRDELKSTSEALSQHSKKTNELREELASKEREMKLMKLECDELKQQNSRLVNLEEDLQSEIGKRQKAESSSSDSASKTSDLRLALQESEETMEMQDKLLNSYTQQIKELESFKASHIQQETEMMKEHTALRDQIDKLNSDLTGLKETVDRLQQEIEKAAAEKQVQEKELEKQKSLNKRNREEVEVQEKELEKQKSLNKRNREEMEVQEKELEKQKSLNKRNREEMENWKKERDEVAGTLEQYMEKVKGQNKELSRENEKLKKDNADMVQSVANATSAKDAHIAELRKSNNTLSIQLASAQGLSPPPKIATPKSFFPVVKDFDEDIDRSRHVEIDATPPIAAKKVRKRTSSKKNSSSSVDPEDANENPSSSKKSLKTIHEGDESSSAHEKSPLKSSRNLSANRITDMAKDFLSGFSPATRSAKKEQEEKVKTMPPPPPFDVKPYSSQGAENQMPVTRRSSRLRGKQKHSVV